jgi:AraC family transcriptional regulator
MEHAKRLLAGDKSVSAIAFELGFASNSNFCFAFRKATGMSPGSFRQTLLHP